MQCLLPVTNSDIYFAAQVFGIIYAIIAVVYLSYLIVSTCVAWNNRRKYHKKMLLFINNYPRR
jgi:hypothetical protein